VKAQVSQLVTQVIKSANLVFTVLPRLHTNNQQRAQHTAVGVHLVTTVKTKALKMNVMQAHIAPLINYQQYQALV